jgi:carbonic anhydrase
MGRNDRFMSRRNFLQVAGFGGVSLFTAAVLNANIQPAEALETLSDSTPPALDTPNSALKKLLAGNQRFVDHQQEYPHQTQSRLQEVALAQHPFATILSCADSRVPAEMIFDIGIGDIFDIRIAGNIVTPEVLGSLEYAAVLLGTPLIMVLGHERCGAVTAAVKDEALPGNISAFVKAVKPAIATIKGTSDQAVEAAVLANIHYQLNKVKQNSTLIMNLLQAGKLTLIGGRYDLDTGRVTLV